MPNIFSEIEDNIFFNETIIFDEEKIKCYILEFLTKKLAAANDKERPFLFEQIIYDFFDYEHILLIRTKKTRDFGIDGVVKLNMQLIGNADIGLQIKFKQIDSTDIDSFSASLKNAELQLGVLVCKESRRLDKYNLNSKLTAILFSRGIKLKERLIEENINLNPIFILKFQDVIDLTASNIRAVVKGVYKK